MNAAAIGAVAIWSVIIRIVIIRIVTVGLVTIRTVTRTGWQRAEPAVTKSRWPCSHATSHATS